MSERTDVIRFGRDRVALTARMDKEDLEHLNEMRRGIPGNISNSALIRRLIREEWERYQKQEDEIIEKRFLNALRKAEFHSSETGEQATKLSDFQKERTEKVIEIAKTIREELLFADEGFRMVVFNAIIGGLGLNRK